MGVDTETHSQILGVVYKLSEEWRKDCRRKGIHIMKYYKAEKNNNLNFAGKWIELENIILIEVSQTQNDNYHIYSLINGF